MAPAFPQAGSSSCSSKDFIEAFDYAADLLAGGGASEAETDGTFPNLRRHAHRLEHRRKLHASGMTRRARRGCYPFQPRQYLAADLADEGDIERIRQTMYRMAVEEHAFSKSLLEHLPKVVTQDADLIHWSKITRKLADLAETNRKECALRPCTPTGFVSGAMDQWFNRHAAPHK